MVNMAEIHIQARQYPQASSIINKALQVDPENHEANLMLGLIYKNQRQYHAAIPCYLKAQNPHNPSLFRLGQLAECYANLCAWEQLDTLEKKILHLFNTKHDIEPLNPFQSAMLFEDNKLQMHISQKWVEYLKIESAPFKKRIYNHHKLRIGYISSDLSEHPVAFWIQNLFTYHNRDKFKIYGFPTVIYDTLEYQAVCSTFDEVIELDGLSHLAAAKKIYDLEIDILIDLTGPTEQDNYRILAHQPATIQCHMMGFLGTLGFKHIQYAFSYQHATPSSFLKYHTENVVFLKHMPPAPKVTINHANLSRQEYGLPEDAIVYCCFSSPYRITQDVFNCWMTILAQVTNSVLWLGISEQATIVNLLQHARTHNISQARIIFTRPTVLSKTWHHKLADLWLDTFRIACRYP